MIFLAFIAGLLASRWLEDLLVKSALRVLKGRPLKAVERYAKDNELPSAPKGRILSLKGIDAKNALTKGGTLEEILDGSHLPEEENL